MWIFQKVHKRSIAFSLKWGSIVPAYNYPSGLCSAGLQKLSGLKVSSMMMTREAEQLSRWCPLGCHITHALPQTKGSHLKPNSRAKPYYCRQNIQWRKIVLKMFVVFHSCHEKSVWRNSKRTFKRVCLVQLKSYFHCCFFSFFWPFDIVKNVRGLHWFIGLNASCSCSRVRILNFVKGLKRKWRIVIKNVILHIWSELLKLFPVKDNFLIVDSITLFHHWNFGLVSQIRTRLLGGSLIERDYCFGHNSEGIVMFFIAQKSTMHESSVIFGFNFISIFLR